MSTIALKTSDQTIYLGELVEQSPTRIVLKKVTYSINQKEFSPINNQLNLKQESINNDKVHFPMTKIIWYRVL